MIEVQLAALAAERGAGRQIEKLRPRRADGAASRTRRLPGRRRRVSPRAGRGGGKPLPLRAMTDIRALLKQDMELGAEAAIRRFGDLRSPSSRTGVSSMRSRPVTPTRPGDIRAVIVRRNREFVLGLYALAPGDLCRLVARGLGPRPPLRVPDPRCSTASAASATRSGSAWPSSASKAAPRVRPGVAGRRARRRGRRPVPAAGDAPSTRRPSRTRRRRTSTRSCALRRAGCDGLVGLGGGSSMDAAKAARRCSRTAARSGTTAAGTWCRAGPPVVCLPTTCGTGAGGDVRRRHHRPERALQGRLRRPQPRGAASRSSIPSSSSSAPAAVIAATGADALAHAVESYLNLGSDPLLDAINIRAIRMIGANLRAAVDDRDREAIGQVSLASTMTGSPST